MKAYLWPGSGIIAHKPKWIVAAELVHSAKPDLILLDKSFGIQTLLKWIGDLRDAPPRAPGGPAGPDGPAGPTPDGPDRTVSTLGRGWPSAFDADSGASGTSATYWMCPTARSSAGRGG